MKDRDTKELLDRLDRIATALEEINKRLKTIGPH